MEDATARQIGGTESQRVVFRIKDANGNQVTSLNNFTNLSLQFLADDPLYTVLVSPADGVTPLNPNVGSGTYLSSANASIWAGKILADQDQWCPPPSPRDCRGGRRRC